MRYKVKYEKSNLIFMSSILILCLIMCIFFVILNEYVYCTIYAILTLILIHTYYFTTYTLDKEALVIRLGFIPIKIKYEHIWNVESVSNGVKITTKSFPITIYPDEIKNFVKELKKKVDKSLNIKK